MKNITQEEWEAQIAEDDNAFILDVRTQNEVDGLGGNGMSGGRILKLSWNGEVLWDDIFVNNTFQPHHDIEPLPNGNVLLIAWEKKTASEGYAMGREVIDNPFNTYSTGMRMRLAFSISTMIDPDILLLDEWLGAGDAGFRRKINNRMDCLIEQSRGLVVASHNMSLMKDLCTHGLVLSNGSMIFCGGLAEAFEIYQKEINPKS